VKKKIAKTRFERVKNLRKKKSNSRFEFFAQILISKNSISKETNKLKE